MRWLDGSQLEHCRHGLVIVCILLHSCRITSPASPSTDSSTPPERCHPEDVLLVVLRQSGPAEALRWPAAAGQAAQVEKFVHGVSQGCRYEARLLLVKPGFEVHQEWSEWQKFDGNVEQDDQSQRISFAVPPLPAGHYAEHFDVYDACGLSASLSASGNYFSKSPLLVNILSKHTRPTSFRSPEATKTH